MIFNAKALCYEEPLFLVLYYQNESSKVVPHNTVSFIMHITYLLFRKKFRNMQLYPSY